MDDLSNASFFFLIFAAMLMLYGAALAITGDKQMMPYHVVHSIRSREDVRRVGRIVVVIGLVIGVVSLLIHIIAGASLNA